MGLGRQLTGLLGGKRAAVGLFLASSLVPGLTLAGCTDDDSTAPAKGDVGLEDAPAATTLAALTFTQPVADTVPAGEVALVLYESRDIGIVDLADLPRLAEGKTPPPIYGPLPTAGKVIAVDVDEERAVAFAVDVTGAVYVLDLAGSKTASIVASLSVADVSGKVTGIGRIGDTLYVVAGDQVRPVLVTFNTGAAPTLVAQAGVALGRAALFVSSGAGALYIGVAGGEVEAWTSDGRTPLIKRGLVATQGELRALLAKGSKVLALTKGVGLRVLDFGVPAVPSIVSTTGELKDVSGAKLFGPTLLVAVERSGGNLLSTLDVSIFGRPKAVTTNKGDLPKFFGVVAGNIVMGSGVSGSVAGVPPVVAATVPTIIQRDFPQNGQIPVVFSKVIDPTSATAESLKLTCNGVVVAGAAIVAPDRLTVTYRPLANMPAGANCVLDASAVKDTTGLPAAAGAGGSSFSFTVANVAPAPVANPGSKFPHSVDGKFTGYVAPSPDGGTPGGESSGQFEWFDVKPAKGMYTYFYADFDQKNLWLLNDWFYNGSNIDPDCYNQFGVWTGGGSERWEIRAYGNQKVEVRKNGELLDAAKLGLEGGFSYGASSPNVTEPHTIWELKIPVSPGTWGVQLHDPGPTFHCSRRMGDPSSMSGSLGGAAGSTASSLGTVGVNPPPAPVLSAPEDNAPAVPTAPAPTLRWNAAAVGPEQFIGYDVELATSADFRQNIWRRGTTDAFLQLPSGLALAGTKYFWRVSAWNWAGRTASTTVRTFTTAPVVGPNQTLVVVNRTNGGSVSSEPGGIQCGPTCAAGFNNGTAVTLTARADEGFDFVAFQGDCQRAGELSATVVTNGGTKTCTASFRAKQPTTGVLTVNKNGTGTVTTVEGSTGINCGNDCSETYNLGTAVQLQAVAGSGSTFTGWTNCANNSQSPTISVTINGNVLCTANFGQATTNYILTIQKTGQGSGSVQSSPTGINGCSGTCNGSFAANSTVNLTATASNGSTFVGFGQPCTGSGNTGSVTMTTARSCTAQFDLLPTRNVQVTVSESGQATGQVTTNPSIFSCTGGTCSGNALQTQAVALSATALGNNGTTFVGWTGACAAFCQSQDAGSSCMDNPLTLPASANAQSCTANFSRQTYSLTVVRDGTPGTSSIVSSSIGLACGSGGTCSVDVPAQSSVGFTINTAAGHRLTAWSGDCSSCTPTQCGFTMNGNKPDCRATYLKQTGLLYGRSGSGTVQLSGASPTGVTNCNSTQCQGYADPSGAVSLTATPSNGYAFAGWSGNDGRCTGTANPLQFTNLGDTDITCSATFNVVQPTTYNLSVTRDGTGTGSVTATVGQDTVFTCPSTCSGSAAANSNVQLVATPDADSTFSGWDGNCSGTNATTSLDLTGNRSCTATFTKKTVTLTMSRSGPGNTNLRATPTVTPATASNCNPASGGSQCTPTVAQNTTVTVTANNATSLYTLTLTKAGSGTGGLTAAGYELNLASSWQSGTTKSWSVDSGNASVLTKWAGSCTATQGSSPPAATIAVGTSAVTCTATLRSDVLVLSASPTTGIATFSGDCTDLGGNEAELSLTGNTAKACTVTYTP